VTPADEQCIGTQYASMHLAATLGTAAVLMDWEHERTPDSDEIQVIAGYVPLPIMQDIADK
jgi:C-22 sterol desaturase